MWIFESGLDYMTAILIGSMTWLVICAVLVAIVMPLEYVVKRVVVHMGWNK